MQDHRDRKDSMSNEEWSTQIESVMGANRSPRRVAFYDQGMLKRKV